MGPDEKIGRDDAKDTGHSGTPAVPEDIEGNNI